jgi:hypothetical protein
MECVSLPSLHGGNGPDCRDRRRQNTNVISTKLDTVFRGWYRGDGSAGNNNMIPYCPAQRILLRSEANLSGIYGFEPRGCGISECQQLARDNGLNRPNPRYVDL